MMDRTQAILTLLTVAAKLKVAADSADFRYLGQLVYLGNPEETLTCVKQIHDAVSALVEKDEL